MTKYLCSQLLRSTDKLVEVIEPKDLQNRRNLINCLHFTQVQSDQTIKLKVPQSFPISGQSKFYVKRVVFKIAQRLSNIWANFVIEYVYKTLQKNPNLVTLLAKKLLSRYFLFLPIKFNHLVGKVSLVNINFQLKIR